MWTAHQGCRGTVPRIGPRLGSSQGWCRRRMPAPTSLPCGPEQDSSSTSGCCHGIDTARVTGPLTVDAREDNRAATETSPTRVARALNRLPARGLSTDEVPFDLADRMIGEVLVDLSNDFALHVGVEGAAQVGERARRCGHHDRLHFAFLHELF